MRSLVLVVLLGVLATACDGSSCEDVIDHVQPCCEFTDDQVSQAKDVCGEQDFSDAQEETFECVLDSTCEELLDEGACGGLVCLN
jgi:hypothetical protein